MRFLCSFFVLVSSTTVCAQEVRDFVVPVVGAPAVAGVGETVYEKGHLSVLPAYVINESFVGKNVFATVILSPGDKFIRIASKSKLKACRSSSIENFLAALYDACLYDDDGDGVFDRYGANEIQGGKKLPHPLSYKTAEFVQPSSGSLKQVVIYLGSTKDSLRLSYREFVNDMARPAFTEEYTFPLATAFPQKVAFKGVKLDLSAIDGEGMHYKVTAAP